MYEPKVGDIVDITARGVEIINTYGTSEKPVNGPTVDTGTVLVYRHPGETRRDRSHTVNRGAPGVTVEAGTPEVRPRDVVADRDEDLWLATGDAPDDLRMVSAVGTYTLSELVDHFGPIRIAWRGGQEKPTPAADPPPEAEPVETEMWAFAVHVPRGSAQQVVSAIETVPGVDIYRAHITGAEQ